MNSNVDMPMVPMMGRCGQFEKHPSANVDDPSIFNLGVSSRTVNYPIQSNNERLNDELLASALSQNESIIPILEQNLYTSEEMLVNKLTAALAASLKISSDQLFKSLGALIKKENINVVTIYNCINTQFNTDVATQIPKIESVLDKETAAINAHFNAVLSLSRGRSAIKESTLAAGRLKTGFNSLTTKKVTDLKGNIMYLKGNWLHKSNGPAYISAEGDRYWFTKGLLHRDNDLPAVELTSGEKHWYRKGLLHRDNDLPAKELTSGEKHWYYNGLRHRLNKPSVIWSDGKNDYMAYYQNGVCHNIENVPAVLFPSGTKFYYVKGAPHRTNGPALAFSDKYDTWFKNGIKQGF